MKWTQETCRPIVYARAGLGMVEMARCERCGASGPLSMDHIRNRSQGGDWSPSNIVVLCGDGTTGCHGWKTHHADAARAEGYARQAGDPPAEFQHPQLKFRVRLDDDGNLIPAH